MSIVTPEFLEIRGAKFTSNVAELGNGGAVSMRAANDYNRDFIGYRFERNEAIAGGALYLSTSEGEELIADSTFSGNYAGMGCPGRNMGFREVTLFCRGVRQKPVLPGFNVLYYQPINPPLLSV